MQQDTDKETELKIQSPNESSQHAPALILNKPPDLTDPKRKPITNFALVSTFNLFVGKIQDGIATLLSDDFNLIEIPINILPSDIRKGNILKISIERNIEEEENRKNEILFLQKVLLEDENLFLKGTTSN